MPAWAYDKKVSDKPGFRCFLRWQSYMGDDCWTARLQSLVFPQA